MIRSDLAAARVPWVRSRVLWVGLALLGSLVCYYALLRVAASLATVEVSGVSAALSWAPSLSKEALRKIQGDSAEVGASARFLGCCGALFGIYGLLLRALRGAQPNSVQFCVFGSGVVLLAALVCSPIMFSSDMYAYALYGRLASIYHSSPYIDDPGIVPTDPYLRLLRGYLPSVYGPLWTMISSAVSRVSGENTGMTVALFRVLAAGSVAAGAGFIWSALRRYAPERTAQGLALFMWNPLVLLEAGVSGHNDATMVAFMLAAVWLHVRGYKASAVVAFLLSAMVKFLTGVLAPLYMLMVASGTPRLERARLLY